MKRGFFIILNIYSKRVIKISAKPIASSLVDPPSGSGSGSAFSSADSVEFSFELVVSPAGSADGSALGTVSFTVSS